jgi:hypothetical protein
LLCLNRTIFRIVSLALILALLSVPAVINAEAQDPSRPPEPKRPAQQQDARERKGAQRQGAQPDEQIVDKEGVIKVETDLVLLDVTVVDQNNTPIMSLKKEDFSVYEDKVKQTSVITRPTTNVMARSEQSRWASIRSAPAN